MDSFPSAGCGQLVQTIGQFQGRAKFVVVGHLDSGQFSEVAQAMGAYSEKITDPQEIVPALKRGLACVDAGRPTGLVCRRLQK